MSAQPVLFPNVFLTELREFGLSRTRVRQRKARAILANLFREDYTLFDSKKSLFLSGFHLLLGNLLDPSNPYYMIPEDLRRLEEAQAELQKAVTESELRRQIDEICDVLSVSDAPEVRAVISLFRMVAQRLLTLERPIVSLLRAKRQTGEIPDYPEDQRKQRLDERVDPLWYLKKYYGEFLSYFGAPENRLSQSDLRNIDPRFFRILDSRTNYLRRRDHTHPDLATIIPPLRDVSASD